MNEPELIEPRLFEPGFIEPGLIEPEFIEPVLIEPELLSMLQNNFHRRKLLMLACLRNSGAQVYSILNGKTQKPDNNVRVRESQAKALLIYPVDKLPVENKGAY